MGSRPVLSGRPISSITRPAAPLPRLVVVPVTTRNRGIAVQMTVKPPVGGLRQASVLLPEQLYGSAPPGRALGARIRRHAARDQGSPAHGPGPGMIELKRRHVNIEAGRQVAEKGPPSEQEVACAAS
jgi:mRNA-degrading endonuclease toxin of MazEF toxin-antitoxin module